MINIIKTLLWVTVSGLAVFPFSIAGADSLAYLKYTDDFWQVHIRDTETDVERKITNTKYDKTRISWVGENRIFVNGVQGQMAIIDLTTARETSLPFISSHVNDAVISKDGRFILYSSISDTSDLNRLYIYDRSSGDITELPKRDGLQFDPAWSRQSEYFFFVAGDDVSPYSLWKSSLDGSDQRVVVRNKHHNLDINESRNGVLAYSSNRSGNYDIWLENNGSSRQLTEHDGYDGKPVWANDNKTIYFESARNGVVNIWSISVSNDGEDGWGKPVQVTHSEKGARLPVAYAGD